MTFNKFKSLFTLSDVKAMSSAACSSSSNVLTSYEKQLADVDSEKNLMKVFKKLDKDSHDQIIPMHLKFDEAVDHLRRNRYSDIFPYNHNRVKLASEFDYINASYFKDDKSKLKFIIAQGPLQNTREHFWQMVVENECPAIFMLNQPSLHDSVHYFPTKVNETVQIGDYKISMIELLSESDDYCVRSLKVEHANHVHLVVHAHFTAWPDFGVPHELDRFIAFVEKCHELGLIQFTNKSSPVIHCTAGIGRSGVFLVVNVCLGLLQLHPGTTVDLCHLLLELRQQRMWLIQTPIQYKFTLKVMVAMIRNGSSLTFSKA